MTVLRVALQMDPIGGVNPRSDSTLLLGLEAQKRGYELYYYTPDKLTWRDGSITAAGHRITLHADPAHHYDLGEALTLNLKTMDVILLRQDPPFDMAYITTTYMLEQLHPRPLVVNHPASVRNFPEKWMPVLFAPFMPPTLITSDVGEIERFHSEYQDIVIKPFYGFGGHGIFHFAPGDDNMRAMLEMHFSTSQEPLMAQKFLPEVKTGDRRVILIDGEIGAVFGRIPAAGEIRANMRVGGKPVSAELTPRQRAACEKMGPVLKEKGLLLAGIDFIGDWLTEINLTSPTGLAAARALYGMSLEADMWDAIERYLP